MLNSKINPYVVEQQKFLLDAIDVVIWSILFFTGKNYKQLWMTLYNVLEEHWKKSGFEVYFGRSWRYSGSLPCAAYCEISEKGRSYSAISS